MAAVHDVLFRLIGDEDDAQDALERVATELEAFSRIHAEAEAEVETGEALIRLRELKASLEDLDRMNVDPRIDVDIAGVMAQIKALEAELAQLDANDVVIDVDVRRGIMERLASMTKQTTLLSRAVSRADDETKSFGARILDSTVNMGPFTTQIRVLGPLLGILASVAVSVVAAVAAMAASLTMAIGGALALGTAFVGALIPAVGLGIAAFQRFEQQAKKAGTPAHALAQAFKEVGSAAKSLLPAADPVLSALANIMRAIAPLIRSIKDDFMVFGRAAGDALRQIGAALRDPAIKEGIGDLIRLSAEVLPPLVDIGIQLGRIFLNIARAAMPLLAEGLRGIADGLRGIADSTENVGILRIAIAGLVDHLRVWLDLIGNIGRLFLNLFRGAADEGKAFTQWLSDAIGKMADFLGSAEGMERVDEFFADVLPVAKEFLGLIGDLIMFFIQFGQATAPIVQPLIAGFRELVQAINFVLNAINSLPAPLRQAIGFAATFLLPWTKVRLVIQGLIILFGGLKSVIGAIAGFVGGLLSTAFNAAKTAAAGLATAVTAAWNLIKTVTTAVWGTIKTVVTAAVGVVRSVVTTAWNVIRSVTTAVWNTLRSIIGGAIRGAAAVVRGAVSVIRSVVTAAWNAVRAVTSSVWNALKSIVSGAMNAIKGVVSTVGNAIKSVAKAIWEGIKSTAQSALGALKDIVSSAFSGLAGVISAAGGAIADAARAIWQTVKDIISAPINFVINIPTPGGDMSDFAKQAIPGGFAGFRDFAGGLALVGEKGPELAFLPEGSDLFTARESRNIMRSLTKGKGPKRGKRSLEVGAADGSGSTIVNQDITIEAPSKPGVVDEDAAIAKLGLRLRQLGARA